MTNNINNIYTLFQIIGLISSARVSWFLMDEETTCKFHSYCLAVDLHSVYTYALSSYKVQIKNIYFGNRLCKYVLLMGCVPW